MIYCCRRDVRKMFMSFDYIIVQAGGRGSRMESLTDNKPKALIPVDNLPILFHLFKKFPDKVFVIIGDYRFDVLKKYLNTFTKVNYNLVNASGSNGTCSGIRKALSFVPQGKSFMLIWCDLILNEMIQIDCNEENIIGISDSFPCRWKYEEGRFYEVPSNKHGVAGLFVFNNRDCLKDVPDEGEFVHWLSSKGFVFKEVILKNSYE